MLELQENMTDIWTSSAKTSPDVLYQELNGESVLLNLATEKYFGLDPVGTRVWQLLSEGVSLEAAFATLLQEYEVDEPRLRADVAKLVSELESAQLVTLVACSG